MMFSKLKIFNLDFMFPTNAALCIMSLNVKSALRLKQIFCPAVRQIRTKKKIAFKQFRRKDDAHEIARDYFDVNYAKVFENEWPAVRCAMLSRKKYCAVLNNFVDTESYEEKIIESGAYDFIKNFNDKAESKQNAIQKQLESTKNELESLAVTFNESETSENDAESETESRIDELESLIENLDVELETYKRLKTVCSGVRAYVYPRADITELKQTVENFLYRSFLLDGASLLPVMALDPRPSDTILDMCSAPGAKLNIMIQALGGADNIVANDDSISRVNGIKRLFRQFYPSSFNISESLKLASFKATEWEQDKNECFSKILVDVPCTEDRRSMYTPENDADNIFSQARKRERGRLPELQSLLLMNAIRACQVGGTIVYTTNTASPIQNQYVVQITVQEAFENLDIVCEVEDITPITSLLENEFNFKTDIELGSLVYPRLESNFGPTYICKLRRVT